MVLWGKTVSITMSEKLITNKEEADIFVRQLLNIGEAMYRSGGEISRIEDSLHRLGKVYGAKHVSVYALTSNIVVTVEFEGDYSVSQNRRIKTRESIDCKKMEDLNQLCRECVANPVKVISLQERVLSILNERPKQSMVWLGQFIAAVAFTFFFGGSYLDAIVAAVGVLLIIVMQKWVRPVCSGALFFNVVVSFATGLIVSLANLVIPGLHVNQILIGDIMVLIPGIPITNSIRYILSGDTISSFEKLVDSLLQAFGIAAGFMLALLTVHGEIVDASLLQGNMAIVVQMLSALIGTFGYCLIFNIQKKIIMIPTIGGAICMGMFFLCNAYGFNVFSSVLTAAFVVGMYGVIFARIAKVPTTILFIPACVPLVPGRNLYYSALAILSSDLMSLHENAVLLALTAVGISIGLALAGELERFGMRIARKARGKRTKLKAKKKLENN